MAKVEPKIIKPADIDPNYHWDRPLMAPGRMNVDFEERVNFQRLHNYRLARARMALANSGLGAVLCFDMNNIRYLTSTTIGEWARDKFCRYALLTGTGDPHLWDFGSAAAHHRLHSPLMPSGHYHAGMLGMRGTVPPSTGFMQKAAEEIKAMLDDAGVGKMPVGVDMCEPPMLFALQKAGIDVRDGQQTMRSRCSTWLLPWWTACTRQSSRS
jgi:Xaa-Pro dipeptidase